MTKPTGDPKRAFDLEERTARFGEAAIDLAKKVRITEITSRLVPQFVAAATSVLKFARDSIELDDLAERVDALEKTSKEKAA